VVRIAFLKDRIIFSGYSAPAAEGGPAMAGDFEIDPEIHTRLDRADVRDVNDQVALASSGATPEFEVEDR